MKLCLKLQDQINSKIVSRRSNRRLRSKAKAAHKRAGKNFGTHRPTSKIQVPHALNIEGNKNRKQFLRFMNDLRNVLLDKNHKVILDFGETDVILPSAMILLVAEIDRAKRIFKEKFKVSIANVKNKVVKQLLVQIGMYELCDSKPPKLNSDEFEDNVRHWRYATAERADEDTNDAFASIEGLICSNLRKGMWRGVSEAIINSVQHAYIAPRGVPGPRMNHKRWWMFSQEKNDNLTVVVCDLGIGIPRSLPLNWEETLLAKLMSPFTDQGTDAAALRASLTVGRTSTGQKHRGKGLPQIWAAVRGEKKAGILIHSNRARLSWSGETDSEACRQFEDSIFGTVIMWTVPVASAVDEVKA